MISLWCAALLALAALLSPAPAEAASDASVARWLVNQADFATVSTLSIGHEGISVSGSAFGNAQDISDGTAPASTGVINLYLSSLDPTGADILKDPRASITISESQLKGGSGCGGTDAEDPTCAKITLNGELKVLEGDSANSAKSAIESRHPAVKKWPSSHDFFYLELNITDIFFLDNYGGVKEMTVAEYYAAEPEAPAHLSKKGGKVVTSRRLLGFREEAKSLVKGLIGSSIMKHASEKLTAVMPKGVVKHVGSSRPIFLERSRVARWMVHQAQWGVLSTVSTHLNGAPFGNVLSVSDSVGTADSNSTGRLFFYLTDLDPSGEDIQTNPTATFGLTEASLPANSKSGKECRGIDAEDPTCARVTFQGQMVKLISEEEVTEAKNCLFSRHPAMASWPAGHNFAFYELKFDTIYFLDFYGGQNTLKASDYWAASP